MSTAPRILQVGYHFPFHPLGPEMKRRLAAGRLGRIRYLGSRFSGFKRTRGATGLPVELEGDGI